MEKKEFFRIYDLVSYLVLIIATIAIIIFQFTGNIVHLKVGIFIFEIAVLLLTVFLGIKIFFVFKKEDNKDELFVLTKGQKIWLIIKFAISLIMFCWITIILIGFLK